MSEPRPPVIPGPAGAARPPVTRANKVLLGRVHLAVRPRRFIWPVKDRWRDLTR